MVLVVILSVIIGVPLLLLFALLSCVVDDLTDGKIKLEKLFSWEEPIYDPHRKNIKKFK